MLPTALSGAVAKVGMPNWLSELVIVLKGIDAMLKAPPTRPWTPDRGPAAVAAVAAVAAPLSALTAEVVVEVVEEEVLAAPTTAGAAPVVVVEVVAVAAPALGAAPFATVDVVAAAALAAPVVVVEVVAAAAPAAPSTRPTTAWPSSRHAIRIDVAVIIFFPSSIF